MTGTANFADRFEASVDRHPDGIAVESLGGPVTYAQLDARANQVATWLRSSGVSAGSMVGIALWNRIEHIELLLGAFKARAIPVNINCEYTTDEMAPILDDSQTGVVVCEHSLASSIASMGVRQVQPIGDSYEAILANQSPARIPLDRDESDHYVLYTGGTTGMPKGVVWRQRDLYDAVLAGEDGDPIGRVLPASPFSHGTAQWTVLAALLHGSTVVLPRPNGLDAVQLWDRVEATRTSRLVIVGDAFARPLLDALDAEPDRWNLTSLVAITSGGARWSEAARLGLLDHLPHAVMVNSFGATETGGQGTQTTFAGQAPAPTHGLMQFRSDSDTIVLGDDNKAIAPGSDQVGLLARTGSVPLGYLNDPDATERVFPTIGGIRHAIPGDLAMVTAEGEVVVLGRDRNVMNTGGEKVYAEEVESRLIGHPAVADAVVVGIPDARWGECIGALVCLQHGASVSESELADHCASSLARFKVPRFITITDSIHHLPSGKLDRAWAADTMSGLST